MKSPARATLRFIAVLLLWHAGFIALQIHYGILYMGDSWEYVTAGYNLLERGWLYSGSPSLPVVEEYMTQRTPLYPAFLAGVYALGGTAWTAILLQSVVSILTLALLRRTLLRLGHNSRYDWLLLLLLLTYPPQIIHALWIEPEALLQLFSVFYFDAWVRLLQARGRRYGWLASLWLVLGLFTKPVLYPFVIVHFLLLLFAGIRWKKVSLPVAALLPVLAVAGYLFLNKTRTGQAHFSSNQAFNAIYYAAPYIAHKHSVGSAAQWLTAQRTAIARLPDFKSRYTAAEKIGRTFLRENASGYIPFHLAGSARLLIDPGKADLDLFSGRLTYGKLYGSVQPSADSSRDVQAPARGWRVRLAQPTMWLALMVFFFNLVRLAGLGLFLLHRRQAWLLRAGLLMFVVYFALLAGPIAAPRYLLPVWPLMAGAAALGWARILAQRLNAQGF